MADRENDGTANTAGSVPGHPGLRPWPKGVSGNPKGRPKNLLREALLKRRSIDDIAEIINRALENEDSKILSEIMAREWPKPEIEQRLTVTGDAGSPLIPAPVPQPPAADVAEGVAKALDRMGVLKRSNGVAKPNGANGHDESA